MSSISTTKTIIEESQIDLAAKIDIPELGSDPAAKKWKQVTLDTRKQNVGSQIAAMSAATAQVIYCFRPIIRSINLQYVGGYFNFRACG